MATHDYVLANQSGAAFSTDLNNALAAIVSNNSNSSAPATTYAYQIWVDTSANIIKIRNSANNAWINLFTTAGGVDVDSASNFAAAVTFTDDVTFDGATAGRDIVFDRSDNALELAGYAQIKFADQASARFGSGDDMIIKHDGANASIDNNTGGLTIESTGDTTMNIQSIFRLMTKGGTEDSIKATTDASVQIHQDNVLRLETETTGVRVNVAGNSGLRIDGTIADVDPRIVFRRHSNDGNNAEPAAIQMTYVAGTTYESGHLSFFTNGDSGSAGLTEKFRIQNDGVKYLDNVFNTSANNQRKSYFNNTGQQYHGRNAHEAYIVFQDVSRTQIGSIARTTNNVAYNTSSDYRLKENVSGLSDGITRIKQLKPSRFNFISEPDITMDGFIAHEVSSIVHEAINGEKDAVITQAMLDADTLEGTVGDPIYQGIDQSKLVPLLVAAVQELIAKVETLEAA